MVTLKLAFDILNVECFPGHIGKRDLQRPFEIVLYHTGICRIRMHTGKALYLFMYLFVSIFADTLFDLTELFTVLLYLFFTLCIKTKLMLNLF